MKTKLKSEIDLINQLLFVPLLFFIQIVSAQDPIAFSNLSPASPEASELGKYGNIPVNLSSGIVNFSIPIYTIENDGFELPISIDYKYSGLRVDEVAGLLGIGWNLNAGGMVARQVRGRPDEGVLGYIGPEMIGLNYVVKPYNELTLTERNYLEMGSARNEIDTQPDRFILSIGNVSATFYFDENKNIVISAYKPYIIELINENDFSQGFKVVDEYGVVYFFQNTEHTYIDISESTDPNAVSEIISGWKITTIVYPNGNKVNFFYSQYSYLQKVTHQSHSLLQNFTSHCALPPEDIFVTSHSKSSISSLQLDSIQFSKGKLEFHKTYQDVITPANYNAFLARLDHIKLSNFDNTVISAFDFVYDDISKTRKLITKIEKTNSNYEYAFEYLGVPSDNIPFYKQDFWGYANANQSGKLLDVRNFFIPRKPNFEEASKGALSKIIYPTKGTTEFLYEPNTYDPGEDNLDDFYTDSGVCAELTESKEVSVMTNAGSNGGALVDVKTFTVASEVYMKLSLHITKNAWPGGQVFAGLRRIEDLPNEGIACTDSSLDNCSSCTMARIYFDNSNTPESSMYQEVDKIFNSSRQLKLLPGNYELYVTAIPESNCGSCGVLAADARIEYSQENVSIRSKETGGIRISKIKDSPNPSTGLNFTLKEYIYETDDGVSEGHLFRTRNLYKDDYSYSKNEVNSDFSNCSSSGLYYRYSSSSNLPLGGYIGHHVIYSKVIERMSAEGVSNGSRALTYSFFPSEKDADPEVRTLEVDEKEYRNARVLKEQFFNSDGDKIKTIKYNYAFGGMLDSNKRVVNYKSALIHDVNSSPTESLYASEFSEFYMNSDVQLINKEEINYLELDSLKVNTSMTYISPQGFLKSKRIVNSRQGIITTKYFYPQEVTSIQSLGDPLTVLEKTAIDELTHSNRISGPVQIETTVEDLNNAVLSRSLHRTNFKDWGLNALGLNSIILPVTVQVSKFNDTLKDFLVYHDYDNNGNPLEVSNAHGTHISYVWGYNRQYVVAKLENAIQAQILDLNIDDAVINDVSTTDNIMRSELNKLRDGLPSAMVTTYTYDPLIGVTSITDPKGYTVYYEYDGFNRLEHVKDAEGNILSKNEYNYKN